MSLYFYEQKSSKLKREIFFATYICRQNWSLPDSSIYYITNNPSSAKLYQKIIQSCKYFFIKNPIFVIEHLRFYNSKTILARTKKTQIEIVLNNISKKLWITDMLDISFHERIPNHVATIVPHFYRCTAKKISLFKQVLFLNEFLIISSSVENITFYYTIVKNKDDSIVPLEKIVKVLPKIKAIFFYNTPTASSITENTDQELLKLSHFSKIKDFHLHNIPNLFDIIEFFKYMKKNKCTKFILEFCNSISEAYKNRLEAIVYEIIETQNHDYKPPYINFNGLIEEKRDKLITLLYQI